MEHLNRPWGRHLASVGVGRKDEARHAKVEPGAEGSLRPARRRRPSSRWGGPRRSSPRTWC